MYVSGFQFQVLTPLFTIHWGLQNKKGRPAWREHQNNVNRKQFEIFKREVFARYHKDPLKMLVPKKPRGPVGGAAHANAGGLGVGWVELEIVHALAVTIASTEKSCVKKMWAWNRNSLKLAAFIRF